ncbi:MAG: carbamoyl-phosphate synthase large subunit [Ramlibacter sp.]|nr:carbamoyl-phosphate synthase large subunit [Ramlibacter sp.]
MRRLLVANRGEIARRIVRTAQRLGMETVAVYSDADAGALHVREATVAHGLGGRAASESYLCIDKLIAAARSAQADAVHPGYGFLSENADFAQAVLDAGLLWVGPPPEAIRRLGNKSLARQLAQSLGVPVLPGYDGADWSDDRLALEAGRIGFPLMVKAAAGGGGRGMRLVHEPSQLAAAVHSAWSEALAAFGSDALLLERALLQARHVEVQLFADSDGNCIQLGERDCSVQRRHQKLIEESPSPALDDALRQRLGECAVRLAQAAGYVGAGTVEFLVDGGPEPGSPVDRVPAQERSYYLLEMNTRLQVEHPVTEAVTGLDLVEWQLRIAQGEALPLPQDQLRWSGHAIEVRLCAEDDQCTPQSGSVRKFVLPAMAQGSDGATLRFDHAITPGMTVPPDYDSMLGKLVAHAPTREQAIELLVAALGRLRILGLATNRALLAACLEHPKFRSGQALIPFLADHGDGIRTSLHAQEREAAVDVALGAWWADCGGEIGEEGGSRRLACPFPRPLRFRHRGELLALRVRESATGALEVDSGTGWQQRQLPEVDCVRLPDGRWHAQAGGVDLLFEDASFDPAVSGGTGGAVADLRAPFNGKVIAVQVGPGSVVNPGQPLLVIESMKLEHMLAATRAGVVHTVHVEAGQHAASGQLLVTFMASVPAAAPGPG